MTFNQFCIKILEEVLGREATEDEKGKFFNIIDRDVSGYIESKAKLFVMDIYMPEVVRAIKEGKR